MIANFDQNLDSYYKNPLVVLEKDVDIWIENNPYIEILESALEILEIELNRINAEQVFLDTTIEERLGNLKLPVDYTSPLPPEIERRINIKHYAFTNLPVFNFRRNNLQYYNINKQNRLLDKYEMLALKIRNKLEDLAN